MKTLELRNGDLVVGSQGFTTCSGVQKIRQDLDLALVEVYGNDRFHPRWGSLLNQFVGRSDVEYLTFYIQAEAQRVVANYVAVQAEQIEQDVMYGNVSRMSTNDIVRGIQDIKINWSLDRVDVRVTLKTVSGALIPIMSSAGR